MLTKMTPDGAVTPSSSALEIPRPAPRTQSAHAAGDAPPRRPPALTATRNATVVVRSDAEAGETEPAARGSRRPPRQARALTRLPVAAAGPRLPAAPSTPSAVGPQHATCRPAGLRNFDAHLHARRRAGRASARSRRSGRTGARRSNAELDGRDDRPSCPPTWCIAPAVSDGVDAAGADPFEIARRSPSMTGWMKPVGGSIRDRGRRRRDVGDEQLFGHRLVERPVDVADVAAEQLVELQVVVRRVVVAVPPEPVAAFRNQHLLARARQRRRGADAGGARPARAARRRAGSTPGDRPAWPIQM